MELIEVAIAPPASPVLTTQEWLSSPAWVRARVPKPNSSPSVDNNTDPPDCVIAMEDNEAARQYVPIPIGSSSGSLCPFLISKPSLPKQLSPSSLSLETNLVYRRTPLKHEIDERHEGSPTWHNPVQHSPSVSTHRSYSKHDDKALTHTKSSSPVGRIDFSGHTPTERLDIAVNAMSDIVPSPHRDVEKDILPSPRARKRKKNIDYVALLKARENGWRLLQGTQSMRPVDFVPVGSGTPIHRNHRYHGGL